MFLLKRLRPNQQKEAKATNDLNQETASRLAALAEQVRNTPAPTPAPHAKRKRKGKSNVHN